MFPFPLFSPSPLICYTIDIIEQLVIELLQFKLNSQFLLFKLNHIVFLFTACLESHIYLLFHIILKKEHESYWRVCFVIMDVVFHIKLETRGHLSWFFELGRSSKHGLQGVALPIWLNFSHPKHESQGECVWYNIQNIDKHANSRQKKDMQIKSNTNVVWKPDGNMGVSIFTLIW